MHTNTMEPVVVSLNNPLTAKQIASITEELCSNGAWQAAGDGELFDAATGERTLLFSRDEEGLCGEIECSGGAYGLWAHAKETLSPENLQLLSDALKGTSLQAPKFIGNTLRAPEKPLPEELFIGEIENLPHSGLPETNANDPVIEAVTKALYAEMARHTNIFDHLENSGTLEALKRNYPNLKPGLSALKMEYENRYSAKIVLDGADRGNLPKRTFEENALARNIKIQLEENAQNITAARIGEFSDVLNVLNGPKSQIGTQNLYEEIRDLAENVKGPAGENIKNMAARIKP